MFKLFAGHSKALTRGVTLLELMVVIAVMALLALAAAPPLADYVTNSRVRESANHVLAQALLTRAEAIKRNGTVRLSVTGNSLQMSRVVGEDVTVLRSMPILDGVHVEPFTVDFDSAGRLTPFGTAVSVAFMPVSQACSADIRCPRVRFEAGGAVSLCPTGECK